MRFVSADEIRQHLDYPTMFAAMDALHRRPRMEMADQLMGDEGHQYFLRHAVDAGRLMGSKLVTSVPGNVANGRLPAIQALCVLFDGVDGRPLAVIDGTEITFWKTAGDSGFAASLLAPSSARTLLVVGAGDLASSLITAHLAARPSLQRVLIWNRSADKAVALADSFRGRGVDAEPTSDLDAAVPLADVITTCTRSHTPLVKGALLSPGTHVDLVGGYTPATRESDDDVMRRARLFVDCHQSAMDGVGDICQPIDHGVMTADAIVGDLYDLVGGTVPGRTSDDELTVFKNAGGGHLDLATCAAVLQVLGIR